MFVNPQIKIWTDINTRTKIIIKKNIKLISLYLGIKVFRTAVLILLRTLNKQINIVNRTETW